MTRKSPIRHKVKSHTRQGKRVNSFLRGKGTKAPKIIKRRIQKSKRVDSGEVERINIHIQHLWGMNKSWKEIEDNVLAQWGGYPDYYSEKALLKIIHDVRKDIESNTSKTEKKKIILDKWRKTRYDEHFKLRTVLKEAKGYIRDGRFSDRGEDEVMVAWNTAVSNFPDPRRKVSLYEANLVDEYYDKLEKYAKKVGG